MGYGDSYEGGDDSDPIRGPMVAPGTYRARGVGGSAQLGETNNGAPQIGASFEIVDGDYQGKSVPWYGYFSEKTKKRTLESLRLAGWSNDDIGEIEGFGDTEVDIVVEHNEWEGKVSARVAWVNRAGSGGLAMKSPMNEAQRKAFAAKMKGEAVMSRQAAEKSGAKTAPTARRPVNNPTARRPVNNPAPAGADDDSEIPF